jgi:hypothetical protein
MVLAVMSGRTPDVADVVVASTLPGRGIQTNHVPQLGLGRGEPALANEESGVVEMRVGAPGDGPDRQAIMGLRLAELFPIGKRIGQVVMRRGQAGIDLDRPAQHF